MTNQTSELTQGIIREFRRRVFEESSARIRFCLSQLNENEVWHRPNNNSNSIGNLILHLDGNVRQWILSGLAEQTDARQRDTEFELDRRETISTLMNRLSSLQIEVDPILDQVNATMLLQVRSVQVYQESGLSILLHVMEHFTYHTGQIVWITKALKDKNLGFYSYLDSG